MPNPRFQTAAVIGTGMMGPGIAVTLALAGVRTAILGRSAESAARGLETATRQIALLEEHGLADPPRAHQAREILSAGTNFDERVAAAALVIESAPENMEFKQDLFARMDRLAPPDTVLASNTSGLSITAIASRCQRPERVVTTHFWNPPHLMPLVEIVRGENTSADVVEALRQLLLDCGKVPVLVKKDRPGQLGNRLQGALLREAIHIVAEGIAGVEDVDLAVKAGFGLRLPVYGIFEHQDIVGLDMVMSIVDYVSRDLASEKGAPELLRGMVSRGELGAKAGKGFYDWTRKSAGDVRARRDQFVLHMLASRFSPSGA